MTRSIVARSAVLILLALAVGCAGQRSRRASADAKLVECKFDTIDEALKAANGKVVVVDCWARWCRPCVARFPHLVDLHHKYADRGVVCMSVSVDNGKKQYKADEVLAFLQEQGATFQNFMLTDMATERPKLDERFGAFNSIPYMVVFGKSGQMVWNTYQGRLSEDELHALVEAELAK